jgi:hypothetical protein
MPFLAHKSTREALTYIRAASHKKMAEAGMAPVHAENLTNLSDWLGKIPPQITEKRGK